MYKLKQTLFESPNFKDLFKCPYSSLSLHDSGKLHPIGRMC